MNNNLADDDDDDVVALSDLLLQPVADIPTSAAAAAKPATAITGVFINALPSLVELPAGSAPAEHSRVAGTVTDT